MPALTMLNFHILPVDIMLMFVINVPTKMLEKGIDEVFSHFCLEIFPAQIMLLIGFEFFYKLANLGMAVFKIELNMFF